MAAKRLYFKNQHRIVIVNFINDTVFTIDPP